jgi:hypothetical protein
MVSSHLQTFSAQFADVESSDEIWCRNDSTPEQLWLISAPSCSSVRRHIINKQYIFHATKIRQSGMILAEDWQTTPPIPLVAPSDMRPTHFILWKISPQNPTLGFYAWMDYTCSGKGHPSTLATNWLKWDGSVTIHMVRRTHPFILYSGCQQQFPSLSR